MDRQTGVIALAFIAFFAAAGTAHAEDAQFALAIKDHKFVPAELQVPSGVKIKLLVKNEDSTPEEFESHELHREKVVPAGKQITILVGPLDAGTYPFFGDYHRDSAQGKLIAK